MGMAGHHGCPDSGAIMAGQKRWGSMKYWIRYEGLILEAYDMNTGEPRFVLSKRSGTWRHFPSRVLCDNAMVELAERLIEEQESDAREYWAHERRAGFHVVKPQH